MEADMGWTDERVETLKRLWLGELSASQIAKQLGGVTRNAVISKVHRLGLSGRAAPGQPTRSPCSRRTRPARPGTTGRRAASRPQAPSSLVRAEPRPIVWPRSLQLGGLVDLLQPTCASGRSAIPAADKHLQAASLHGDADGPYFCPAPRPGRLSARSSPPNEVRSHRTGAAACGGISGGHGRRPKNARP